MWETLKEHKWIAGGVVGLVLLYFLWSGSGGGSSAAPAAGTDPNASALSIAQLQAASDVNRTNAELSAQGAQIGGNIQLAQIAADTANATNGLAAQVALSDIGERAHVADLQATTSQQANNLSATIALGQQHEAENLAAIQSNTTIQNTSLLAGALTDQARISAGVESQAIAVQGQLVAGQNAAALEANKKPKFSLPFGLGTFW